MLVQVSFDQAWFNQIKNRFTKLALIKLGLTKLKTGLLPELFLGASFSPSSRSMIVLQTRTQESQMNTLAGPAIIFRTSPCGFPQKEQKLILVGLAIGKLLNRWAFVK